MGTLRKFKTETEYFLSQEFRNSMEISVNSETWDKGLLKYYINDEGNIIEHFKDGTINVMDGSLSLGFLRKN